MKMVKPIWCKTNAYDGVAVELYVTGCDLGCAGCHNPALQDYNFGDEITLSSLAVLCDKLKVNSDWFDIVAFLGGDLMAQDQSEAKLLVETIMRAVPDKHLWLFTGRELGQLPEWVKKYFNVIKTGSYRQDMKEGAKIPLSSSNQRLNYRGIDY